MEEHPNPPKPPSGLQMQLQKLGARLRGLFGNLGSKLPENLRARVQERFKSAGTVPGFSLETFEPRAFVEWLGRLFQSQDVGFYGKALTIVLCSWFVADLVALIAGNAIPEPVAVHAPVHGGYGGGKRFRTIEDYDPIFARNLFNSKGIIPGDESPSTLTQDTGGAPVRTTLPFNLVGTMVLRDELRSIATIEDKSASLVYPVRVQDEIPGKARILKVEPRRVIFINTSSGRKEFVDLPEDANAMTPTFHVSSTPKGGGAGIEKVSPTQFNIARSEVDRTLSDLNNVLTQARAVPNFENGAPAGYKLFQIVPGSIYSKLGLQDGDVIAGLNGEPINDPGKAFALLNELKTSNHLDLQIKRDGRPLSYSYDINR